MFNLFQYKILAVGTCTCYTVFYPHPVWKCRYSGRYSQSVITDTDIHEWPSKIHPDMTEILNFHHHTCGS